MVPLILGLQLGIALSTGVDASAKVSLAFSPLPNTLRPRVHSADGICAALPQHVSLSRRDLFEESVPRVLPAVLILRGPSALAAMAENGVAAAPVGYRATSVVVGGEKVRSKWRAIDGQCTSW